MVIRAGDCALQSLIASPLFVPVLFCQRLRLLPLFAKEAIKKAPSQPRQREQCLIAPSIDGSTVRSPAKSSEQRI